MGMPITVEIYKSANLQISNSIFEKVFEYFKYVDEKYSPFKENSEVGKLNRGEKVGVEMEGILNLAEETKDETSGYFDIKI